MSRFGRPPKVTQAMVEEIVMAQRRLREVKATCSRAALAEKFGISKKYIADIAKYGHRHWEFSRMADKVGRARAHKIVLESD